MRRSIFAGLIAAAISSSLLSADGINIPGLVDNSAWTPYTPTVTCSTSGTITTFASTPTGRSKIVGKTVFLQANVVITTVGTCLGNLNLTVPATVNATGNAYVGSGYNLNTNLSVPFLGSNSAGVSFVFAASPAANNYFGTITYESN